MGAMFLWPVEVDSFLCELALAMNWVFKRLVLNNFYPFPSIALLMAVFADHVQLSDPVLEDKDTWEHETVEAYQPTSVTKQASSWAFVINTNINRITTK